MHAPYQYKGNNQKHADLTWPKKKKSQGIILAISCTNKAHASKQDDFCMCKGLANYIAKVGGYTYS